MEKKCHLKHPWIYFTRGRNGVGCILGLIMCLFLVQTPVVAQSYTKEITVKFTKDSLLNVIREVNRLGGNCVNFRKEELLKETKLITLDLKRATVLQVLAEVLRGTRLTCVTQKENIVIVPIRQQEQQVKLVKISGRVMDHRGNPLPGATVMVSPLCATATDKDGKFTLNVPENVKVLVFTFVGCKSQRVEIKGQTTIDVTLEEDVSTLEEVVVSTGYYNVEKRHLTSSVTSLKAADIMVPGVNTIDQMLQGHVPGMIFMQNSGQVGAAPRIKIRGTTTVLGSQAPLWVLDGVILTDPVNMDPQDLNSLDFVNLLGNAISGLNPEDIDQVDVLKDASATAIYGPRASNGVIVITTKKGKIGPPSVSYSIAGTFRQRPRYTDRSVNVMNSRERVAYSREVVEAGLPVPGIGVDVGYEALYNKYIAGVYTYGEFKEQVDRIESVNTDWLGELMQDTYSQNHSLSISGGGQNMRYYTSVGFMDERGNIRGESNKRYSVMANVNLNYNKFNVQFGVTGNVQKKDYTPQQVGVMDYAFNTSRAVPAYDEKGDLLFYQKGDLGWTFNQSFNILNEMQNSYNKINTNQLSLNVLLKYNILPKLSAQVTFSYGISNSDEETYFGGKTHYILMEKYEYGDVYIKSNGLTAGSINNMKTRCPVGGELAMKTTQNETYSVRGNITYNRYLDVEENHQLTASLIGELSSSKYDGFGITRRCYVKERGLAFADVDFEKDKMTAYKAWMREPEARGAKSNTLTNLVGLVGTVSYMYKNEYILNANARIDASNKFGDQSNEKLLPIWSVSGRWNMHENIVKSAAWINTLALKASFGYQGNMSQAESPKLIIVRQTKHPFFQEDYSMIDKFPNPDLGWEKTATYNMDVEFAFFKSKLIGSVGYYYRHTTNAFIGKEVSSINGVTKYTVNEGELTNHGVEWTLDFTPINTMANNVGVGIDKKGFIWRFNPNFGTVINQLIDKGKPKDKVILDNDKMDYNSYLSGNVFISGRPVNSFYSYKFNGLNPKTGAPMFHDVEKERGAEFDKMTNDEVLRSVMTRSGAREPFLQGGLSNYFGWSNFSLSIALNYSIGSKIRLFKMYPSGGTMVSPELNMRRELVDRWRRPGDELHTNIPGILTGDAYSEATSLGMILGETGNRYVIGKDAWQMYDNSDERIVSGNYVQVQAISLRYTVPVAFCKRIYMKSAYVAFNASNVYTFCNKKLKGQDPTQSGTSQFISMSIRPTYSVQLNVTF